MPEKYPRPHWGRLYLVLPLAALLLALVVRAHSSPFVRGLFEVGVLLLVCGYVEAWCRLDVVGLLHHPLTGAEGAALYQAREVVAVRDLPAIGAGHPGALGRFYSDLFNAPVSILGPVTSTPANTSSGEFS